MSMRRSSSIYCDQPTCYYFLTQCWIEPQDGFVDTNCPELEFLNHCTYKQIVDKVSFSFSIKNRSMSEKFPSKENLVLSLDNLKSEHVNHHSMVVAFRNNEQVYVCLFNKQ